MWPPPSSNHLRVPLDIVRHCSVPQSFKITERRSNLQFQRSKTGSCQHNRGMLAWLSYSIQTLVFLSFYTHPQGQGGSFKTTEIHISLAPSPMLETWKFPITTTVPIKSAKRLGMQQ
ncbi:hypothetical protein V6N13_010540 [Hibiscus sabdariffa]|uniref:Uncharacterized protein n=1 Tax=Hibiscus sabdariffa TaxID=183260 RepID=A0ABR2NW18_9ROSI